MTTENKLITQEEYMQSIEGRPNTNSMDKRRMRGLANRKLYTRRGIYCILYLQVCICHKNPQSNELVCVRARNHVVSS